MPPAVAAAIIGAAATTGATVYATKSANKRAKQTTTNTPSLRFPLDPVGGASDDPYQQYSDGYRAGGGAAGDTNAWRSYIVNRLQAGEPRLTDHGIGSILNNFPESPLPALPGAGGATGELQDDFMGLLRDQLAAYSAGGSGGGVHIPSVSFNPAHATHAVASLIDMMDRAFQVEPDANLREDIYTRLKSGAQAGANDSIRKITDAARNAGVGPNAPWVQQLMSEANAGAGRDSTQGLTDFFDAYIQASLARRAQALGENAQLQTGVNTFNANADNQVSMFNSSGQLEAARANQQGAMWEGQLGNDAARLRQGDLNALLGMLQFGLTPQQTGSTTESTQSGGGNAAAGLTDLAARLLSRYGNQPATPAADYGGSGGFDFGGGTMDGYAFTPLPFEFNTDRNWQLGG